MKKPTKKQLETWLYNAIVMLEEVLCVPGTSLDHEQLGMTKEQYETITHYPYTFEDKK